MNGFAHSFISRLIALPAFNASRTLVLKSRLTEALLWFERNLKISTPTFGELLFLVLIGKSNSVIPCEKKLMRKVL